MAARKREKPRRKRPSASARRPARPATSRERRASHQPHTATPAPEPVHYVHASPTDHYAREKARRADRRSVAADPLQEAKLAFQQLLAKEAEAQRGGRPKGSRTRGGAKAKPEDIGDE